MANKTKTSLFFFIAKLDSILQKLNKTSILQLQYKGEVGSSCINLAYK